jgi:probable HAF family extracellular repeat protein
MSGRPLAGFLFARWAERKRKMKRKSMALRMLSAYSVGVLSCPAVFGQYQIIDLGALGSNSYASSVNNNGQIVGAAMKIYADNHAVVFDSTGAGNNIDLGTLGGVKSYSSYAFSINNNGQIVGSASISPGSDYQHATLFDSTGAGKNIDLGILPGGGQYSRAHSINDKGQIVGYASNISGYSRATLFDSTGGGKNIDLGTLGGMASQANSINSGGQIVGFAFNIYERDRATLFDSTGAGDNIDLGILPGGGYSIASSINDSGQIVGYADNNSGYSYATLFDSTGAGDNIDLGTIPGGKDSFACSINNSGQIVGWSFNNFTESRATLFDPSGAGHNIDLNTLLPQDSGWTLYEAYSINDNGWIVGCGLNSPTGSGHAFLLGPIPEPCTLALLALGGLAALRRRRARA